MRIKRLLGDRILIRPLPADAVSAGGIIIPESVQGKGIPAKGEVLMIGDDPKILVKKGEWVMFPEQAGQDFDLDGVDVRMIRWIDIQMELDRNKQSLKEFLLQNQKLSGLGGSEYILHVDRVIDAGLSSEALRVYIRPSDRDGSTIDMDIHGNILTPVNE